ncbi:MAG: metallophosphoesterase family protein [Clostridiales bacterium]|nr:metallophosphoesterase family protein [Clostridiales bacterium]
MNLVLIVFLALIAIGLVHGLRSIIVDSKIRYTAVPFASAAVPESLDGYTIAFVTDVHDIPDKKFKQAVEEISKVQPDLLLLGGDFSTKKGTMKRSLEILSGVAPADGIYGVGGTHDNKRVFFPEMIQHSMHPLSNSGVHIREGFYLAGVDDPRQYSPDIEKALEGAGEGDFVLLLSHEPDNTMTQDTASVDLVLSGHTHGGHITFFGKWAPALTLVKDITKYGQRFMSGWASSRDGAPVYVSNGTGSYTSIPRSFAQPEVVFVRLEAL